MAKKKPEKQRAGEHELTGTIVEGRGVHFFVRAQNGDVFCCKTFRGTVSENADSTLAAVGDVVYIKPTNPAEGEQLGEGLITRVTERRMKLCRKRDRRTNRSGEVEHVLASNIDQLVIVASPVMPPLRTGLIDRYLAYAESENLDAIIVINKIDLEEDMDALHEELAVYEELGYDVLFVSAMTGKGIAELRKKLMGKTSVLSGHSGVGKSALINKLLGEEELETGEVSHKNLKGAHTTSNAVMLTVEGKRKRGETSPEYGFVIDTPGIREFALSGIDRDNLRHFFIEFRKYAPDCEYSSCTHTIEPNCAVIDAVEAGKITVERYESYLAIYGSLEDSSF